MNSLEPLSYQQESLPEPGDSLTVAPGVLWLRMPLPFALDHVNLWLLEDGLDDTGAPLWTVVDTGIATDAIRGHWRRLLATHRLRRQIVTHCHPDHLGLAGWLQQETGAPLWITFGEYTMAHMLSGQQGGFTLPTTLSLFASHGLDAQTMEGLNERGNAFKKNVPEIPATFRRIFADETIEIGGRSWRVMAGFGHSPEHAALYCDALRVLISGDMLLPRISTNVSVLAANPDDDPLGLFLSSIARFRTLPADTLVLPSHGLPFRGLHARVAQLEDHHRQRCADLLKACDTPKTAKELMPVLFARKITDAHQAWFAMGEALAHLNHLEQSGALDRVVDGGINRFVVRRH